MWHFCEPDFMTSESLEKVSIVAAKGASDVIWDIPLWAPPTNFWLPPSSFLATLSPVNAGF